MHNAGLARMSLHYNIIIILSLDKRMQGLANERKRSCESTAIDAHSSMLLMICKVLTIITYNIAAIEKSRTSDTDTPSPVILSSDSESGMLEICIRDVTSRCSSYCTMSCMFIQ